VFLSNCDRGSRPRWRELPADPASSRSDLRAGWLGFGLQHNWTMVLRPRVAGSPGDRRSFSEAPRALSGVRPRVRRSRRPNWGRAQALAASRLRRRSPISTSWGSRLSSPTSTSIPASWSFLTRNCQCKPSACSSVWPGPGPSGPTTILAVVSISLRLRSAMAAPLLQPRSLSKTSHVPCLSAACRWAHAECPLGSRSSRSTTVTSRSTSHTRPTLPAEPEPASRPTGQAVTIAFLRR
jgi:hypothetical protein